MSIDFIFNVEQIVIKIKLVFADLGLTVIYHAANTGYFDMYLEESSSRTETLYSGICGRSFIGQKITETLTCVLGKCNSSSNSTKESCKDILYSFTNNSCPQPCGTGDTCQEDRCNGSRNCTVNCLSCVDYNMDNPCDELRNSAFGNTRYLCIFYINQTKIQIIVSKTKTLMS